MAVIDNRLRDYDGKPEYAENFNRILALIDGLRSDMTQAQGTAAALDALAAITTRTVTFDSDGGTAVDAQVVAYGGTAAAPDAPTKDEHAFDGWYSGETLYIFATAVKEDITLTAHWKDEE